MPEVKLRYNPDVEEVELLVDNEVALSSGSDVFASWVESYNEKNPPTLPEPTEEEKLQARVEELENALEIANQANTPSPVEETGEQSSPAELDTDTEE